MTRSSPAVLFGKDRTALSASASTTSRGNMARSKELVRGVGRLSRSQVFAKRGLWKGPKKGEKPAAEPPAETVEKTVGGEKNGGKRLVPTSKAPRYYPAEDVRQPKKSRKSPKTAPLRQSITPGTVLILLAGRFRGKRVVFLKQLESGLLLVTGPFKINGVPLRRVNQAYVIATSTKLELVDFKVDDKINDAYFAKPRVKGARTAEEEFFEGGKPKARESIAETRTADQKTVDAAVIATVKKTEALAKYLRASWGLSKADFVFMLALRAARLRSVFPCQQHTRPHQRHFMQGLCDGFLDLALALPLPPSLPPYSSTIILTAVVTRVALLPVAIWGRQRIRRIEEVVLPQVEKLKPIMSKQILEEMKRDGIRGNKETLQKTHTKRSIALLTSHRKELYAKHHCKPLPSIIIPPLSQLPFFIITTIALGRLSVDPTPFDSESFFTLSTLAHSDPTMTLPILLGILTMANVESRNWVMTAAERERARRVQEMNDKKRAELGDKAHIIQPQKVVKSTLRLLSIIRIIVAAMTPGSVQLYWVSSATFGLIQTWVMDWMDARRKRQFKPVVESLSTSSTSDGHAKAQLKRHRTKW
ncbi:hypothetical protein APHAL10511_001921 [Amanita phalloides]|nr:hypothetical protein APHAL10511_001921 [Amanita phalloides]